jgi:hypothetical protein
MQHIYGTLPTTLFDSFDKILAQKFRITSGLFMTFGRRHKKPVGFRAAQMCRNEPWEGAQRLT